MITRSWMERNIVNEEAPLTPAMRASLQQLHTMALEVDPDYEGLELSPPTVSGGTGCFLYELRPSGIVLTEEDFNACR